MSLSFDMLQHKGQSAGDLHITSTVAQHNYFKHLISSFYFTGVPGITTETAKPQRASSRSLLAL